MQVIEISGNSDLNHFCSKCGKQNQIYKNDSMVFEECEHFIYAGTSEGPDYDPLNLYEKYEGDFNLFKSNLDDNNICYFFAPLPPASLEGYLIYKF